jgi:hypothetical protein
MSTLDPAQLPANVMSVNVPGQAPIVTSTAATYV